MVGSAHAVGLAIAAWRCLCAALLVVMSGCREERTSAAGESPQTPWLTEITADAGLDFVHESGATGGLLLPEIMGPGAALFDYDNDGDLDAYLVNGNDTPDPALSGDRLVNRLFRQEADGRFTDATIESGLGDPGYGMGIAVGDTDNDGHADVYVTNYGPDALYRARGDRTFENITAAAGIDVPGWSCSAAFFDYDRDGYLDLYITQYVAFDPQRRCFNRAGQPDYCGPKAFPPVHDVLLHNNADGTFTDVSDEAGIRSVAAAAGLGVVCNDFDDDGWCDIYVANDAYPNHLWLNQRDGTFRDAAVIMGAAYNLHGHAEAGMGVVVADLDSDALLDLFVTHLSAETNTLYRNLGSAGFMDITGQTGLGASSIRYTGFGVAAFDIELDGDPDLVVVNGRVNRLDPLPEASVDPPWDLLAEPNLIYLNLGRGRFELTNRRVAAFCGPAEVTRGLATGDIDRDGDLDILISNVQGRARLYRNDAPREGHWLSVRAVDPRLQRCAIGAQVTLVCGEQRFVQTISRGSSYLSSREPRAHYGLGRVARIDRIDVRWPDGLQESFPGTDADSVVEVVRGRGAGRK